jgi:hypothetical protein
MLELILAPEMAPFVASLGAVGVIGLFELAAILVFGPVLSHLHVDTHIDIDSSFLSGTMSWLHIGKVPLMVLIVLFLSGFGLAGATIQLTLNAFGMGLADALGAAIPSAGVGIAAVRRVGGLLAKVFADDQSVPSVENFVGETVRIVTGTARLHLPAEAKFTDKFGQTHYVMVEPTDESEEFTEGTEVILGQRTAIGFEASRKTKAIN